MQSPFGKCPSLFTMIEGEERGDDLKDAGQRAYERRTLE